MMNDGKKTFFSRLNKRLFISLYLPKSFLPLYRNSFQTPINPMNLKYLIIRVGRAIRITSPSCSQNTALSVVNALSRSLNSTLITLNRKEVEKMRRAAAFKEIPKSLLTTANLISSLFDEIEEEKEPIVVALTDDIHWLLHSEACGEIFLEELRSFSSRIFFVFVQPDADIKIGQTAYSFREERIQKPVSLDPAPTPGTFPNFASFFQNQNQSPMPGFSYPNIQQQIQHLQQQQQQQQQQQSISNQARDEEEEVPPAFTPLFQQPQSPKNGPGIPGQMPPGISFGRSFQVSIQNGSGVGCRLHLPLYSSLSSPMTSYTVQHSSHLSLIHSVCSYFVRFI